MSIVPGSGISPEGGGSGIKMSEDTISRRKPVGFQEFCTAPIPLLLPVFTTMISRMFYPVRNSPLPGPTVKSPDI
jgi:hypothetical protein